MGQKKFKDLSGEVFGRLTVICCTQKCNRSKGVTSTKFLCLCLCGNKKEINSYSLTRGATKSCGCLSSEFSKEMFTKHGATSGRSKSPTYQTWKGMKERCNNPKNKKYNSYGEKGIKVCEDWNESFENFLNDMGERPEGLTLDRIDNNKGYYKENCRWVDNNTQAYNKNKESKGTSKRVGVSWSESNQKWVARIRSEGKQIWLGSFSSEEEAILAREEAELLYRGFNLK